MVEGGPEKEKTRRETREKEGGKSEEAMVREVRRASARKMGNRESARRSAPRSLIFKSPLF